VRNRSTKRSAKHHTRKRQRAQALLGPRGNLKLSSDRENDPRVVALRDWMVANRFPSWWVSKNRPWWISKRPPAKKITLKEIVLAYNDKSSKALNTLRGKLDEDAIQYARDLRDAKVISWTKRGASKILGAGRSNRNDQSRAIVAVLECIRNNTDDPASIKALIDHCILSLEGAPAAGGQRGRSTASYEPRYRLINEAVRMVCEKFGYYRSRKRHDRECGYSIVGGGFCMSEKRVKEVCETHFPRRKSRK
jgi:hypothetical protein